MRAVLAILLLGACDPTIPPLVVAPAPRTAIAVRLAPRPVLRIEVPITDDAPDEADEEPDEEPDHHEPIVDVEDRCPDDPEDIDGYEDDDGCPDPDVDVDPVLDVEDANDECPYPTTESDDSC